MQQKLDYHARLERLQAGVNRGDYGPLQIEGYYSGRLDQPMQVVLRNIRSLRVTLADLLDDGTLAIPNSEA